MVCHKELDRYRDDFCDTILKLNTILPEEYHINLKLFYNIHNTSFDKILKDTDLLSIIYGRTTGIFGLDKIEQTLDYCKSNNTPTGIVFFKKYKKLYPEIEEIKKRIKDNWQYCSIDDIKFEFTRVYFAISKILFRAIILLTTFLSHFCIPSTVHYTQISFLIVFHAQLPIRFFRFGNRALQVDCTA